MKKSLLLSLLVLLSACAGEPKETYPYGMSEKEWNELSIKDKVRIRRDIYFYERGNINFVVDYYFFFVSGTYLSYNTIRYVHMKIVVFI